MLLEEVEKKSAEVAGLLLWQHNAIEINLERPFRMTSGALAPLYVDCRKIISFPASRELFTSFAHHLCEERALQFDCIAGGETAGIPFGAWLAQRLNKPFVYVRKKPKEHGSQSRVEGSPRGQVLLVEDLITDGGSKLGFIQGLRQAGCSVSNCLTMVDRDQGGAECLAEIGVTLLAIVGITTCLEVGHSVGLLSKEALGEVKSYLVNPEKWGQKHTFSK